jgi:endonuclease I
MRWLLGLLLLSLASTSGCAAAQSDDDVVESSDHNLARSVSYDEMENLRDGDLRKALFDAVKNQQRVGYDNARKIIFNNPAFLNADGVVECNYTGKKVSPNGGTSPGGFNTEHTWPQSRGASTEPAKSDLNHLFPVDSRANSSRGNWEFGTTLCLHDDSVCTFEEGGSGLGRDAQGRWKFEVRPEKRGDVARALFYFSVRYNKAISPAEEATLREWHASDPVDDRERVRNDAVEELQHNRNPFIDRPDFVAKITDF